jgi:hypothetical protein
MCWLMAACYVPISRGAEGRFCLPIWVRARAKDLAAEAYWSMFFRSISQALSVQSVHDAP